MGDFERRDRHHGQAHLDAEIPQLRDAGTEVRPVLASDTLKCIAAVLGVSALVWAFTALVFLPVPLSPPNDKGFVANAPFLYVAALHSLGVNFSPLTALFNAREASWQRTLLPVSLQAVVSLLWWTSVIVFSGAAFGKEEWPAIVDSVFWMTILILIPSFYYSLDPENTGDRKFVWKNVWLTVTRILDIAGTFFAYQIIYLLFVVFSLADQAWQQMLLMFAFQLFGASVKLIYLRRQSSLGRREFGMIVGILIDYFIEVFLGLTTPLFENEGVYIVSLMLELGGLVTSITVEVVLVARGVEKDLAEKYGSASKGPSLAASLEVEPVSLANSRDVESGVSVWDEEELVASSPAIVQAGTWGDVNVATAAQNDQPAFLKGFAIAVIRGVKWKDLAEVIGAKLIVQFMGASTFLATAVLFRAGPNADLVPFSIWTDKMASQAIMYASISLAIYSLILVAASIGTRLWWSYELLQCAWNLISQYKVLLLQVSLMVPTLVQMSLVPHYGQSAGIFEIYRHGV
jgi:hypothetical protein